MKFLPRIIILGASLILSSAMYADDIGFVLTNKSALDGTDAGALNLAQSDKLQMDIELGLGEGGTLNIAGFYQFALNGTASAPVVDHSYDLTDLNAVFTLPKALGEQSVLSLVLGRAFFYDPSAMVFAHKLDGMGASLKTPGVGLRLGIGTTALQFRPQSAVLINAFDMAASVDSTQFLASPRLIAHLDLAFNEFLPRQNLNVALVGQTDLRADHYKAGDATGTDKPVPVSTAYLGLGFDGRLAEGLFYKAWFWGELGSSLARDGAVWRGDTIMAGMADLSFKYFAPQIAGSQFELGANISSGDLDYNAAISAPAEANVAEMNTFFTGITGRGGAYIYTMGYGNSLVPRFSWYFKPQSGRRGDPELGIGFDYTAFLRLVNGGVANNDLLAGTDHSYLASEIDCKVAFRPVSDFGLSLRGGLFLPNTAAVTKPLTWKAGLELSLGL